MTKMNGRRVDLSSLPELRGCAEDVERAIELRLVMIKVAEEALERLEGLKENLPGEVLKSLGGMIEQQLLGFLQEADATVWIAKYRFSRPDPDIQVSIEFALEPTPVVLH